MLPVQIPPCGLPAAGLTRPFHPSTPGAVSSLLRPLSATETPRAPCLSCCPWMGACTTFGKALRYVYRCPGDWILPTLLTRSPALGLPVQCSFYELCLRACVACCTNPHSCPALLQPWSLCHLHLPCWPARGRTRVHVDALSHMHSFGTPALWAVLRRAPLETLW